MKKRTIRLTRPLPRLVLHGIACFAILAITAAPAQAQQQRRRGIDPEQRMQMLQENLALTDEQVVALEPIFAEHDDKRRELFESRAAERQAMQEQMGALRSELETELAEVLTAEQMQAFRKHREEMRKGFQQGRRQRGPPPSEG
jgi:Spy/CpxP family protein refolding chaperone